MEIDAKRLMDGAYRDEVLSALVHAYQAGIVGYCVTRLGEDIGEEVAQAVFITAWATLSKFRQEAAIPTWLFGIAKNKCAQAFRNRSRRHATGQAFLVDIRHHAHVEEPETPEGLDHRVGHFRPLSLTRQRRLLAYHDIAISHEGLCQVF